MLLPRFIRKWLAILRGGVAPQLIFLSVIMGFWFGLMPGWSGLHVVLLVLVFILNVHIGLFLIFGALGKALCFAGAPVLYHIGMAVHEYVPVIPRTLSNIPVIGLTDFSKYAIVGALVAGPICGAIAGLMLAKAVIRFRRMMLRLEDGSEKFKKWYSKTWVRIFDRILIGRRTKDAKSLFTAKTKYIRKAGIVLVALLVGGAVLAGSYVKDGKIKSYATETLTKANGAEVNVGDFNLSLLSSSVMAVGIQVTDAKNPANNQVEVEKIEANASMSDLLLGRLVMENLQVSNLKFDQPRQAPGKVVDKPAEEPEPFDPCDYEVTMDDLAKIEKYIKDAKALKAKIEKLRKWLPKPKEKAEAPAKPQKYLDYLKAKILTPPAPRVIAKHTLLEGVPISWSVFGNSTVTMKNVNDAPAAAKLPVSLELKSNETQAYAQAIVDFNSPDGRPRVSGSFRGFNMSKVQEGLSDKSGLVFQEGTLSGAFDGTVTRERIDISIHTDLASLKAVSGADGILGMDARTTNEVFKVLGELKTTLRIVGPVSDPRIRFDVEGLTDNFKDALVKAGKERLSQEIDKQLSGQIEKALGDNVPGELKEVIKKPSELLEGLGGLFNKKKD